jgi:hypothetical protein
MLIHGRCHCGNISFDLAWDPDPIEIPARACSCTFCSKHGGVWTSNPAAKLRIAIDDRELTTKYAFGTRTAEFLVCGRCGVVPVVTSLIEGRLHAVVNVNAFENVDPSLLQRAPTNFEGEDVQSRLARRALVWITEVQYTDRLGSSGRRAGGGE